MASLVKRILDRRKTCWKERVWVGLILVVQHRVTCSWLSPKVGGKYRRLMVTAKSSVLCFAILGRPDGILRCISLHFGGLGGKVMIRFYLDRDSSGVV